MVAAMLDGGEAGKVATGLLENAESALALMGNRLAVSKLTPASADANLVIFMLIYSS